VKHVLIGSLAISLAGLIGCNARPNSGPPPEPVTFLFEVRAGALVVKNPVVPDRVVSTSIEGGVFRLSMKNEKQEEVANFTAVVHEAKDKNDLSLEITAELKNSEPFRFQVVGLKGVKVFRGDQAMPEPAEFPPGQHKFVIKGDREDR
jgi:hypothetical protein